ncbi:NACHT domain-containing protein [Bradyrhizobium sp. USDA 3397]
MRDDFTKQTIIEIAKGVAYRCSNPECRRPTVGANAAQDGTITIGVAAHICAASPGGPRYNAAQTQEARRSKENGLWLCQNCGRLVDADPNRFTVEQLAEWKHGAQARAFRELVAPDATHAEEAARVGAAIAADDRPHDAAFDTVFERVHAAATTDLATHKRGPLWLGATVELTLRIDGDGAAPSFSISKLPLAIEAAPDVTIVAPPGTGKTTTLLQLAGHALTAQSIVPLYFRLGDWSAGSTGLLTSLHQRAAFRTVSTEDIGALAGRGRLLLLLDGWNELAPDAHKRLRVEIGQIRRDWPDLRIIVTTRRQALDVPIPGPRVDIEPLSEDQQISIADALYGAIGTKMVDDAWRTPGVRALIAIPLYLSALLSGGAQGAMPDTKEAVLRLFVQQHEKAGDHAEALHSALLGCHTVILTELASHLNAVGATTMSEADARRVVTSTAARLREQGQIVAPLEPISVLEALTSHHTLMRSGGGVAFQHQQFQEWYASHRVTGLMLAAARGDAGARVQLRAAILDQPTWEESVWFATERLSREKDGVEVVAHAVRLALPIDAMLAAEMIYRAASAVWDLVSGDVMPFVARWHRPGKVDRAVRFMIVTGRPEFASQIWPLASSSDKQTLIPTLRIAPRFRPRVLGPDLQTKVRELSEETRKELLGLIAGESGLDGMDLAVQLAKADPSPNVQADVVQHLQFRLADRHVASLLADAHEETWELVARRSYAEEIHAPEVVKKLNAIRAKALEQATEPSERLSLLLQQASDDPERDAAISSSIADPRFVVNNTQSNWLYVTQRYAPTALAEGLRQRLEAGLDLPFHAGDVLLKLDVIDNGPIVGAVLDVEREDRNINAAAGLVGLATIDALIDKYLATTRALRTARDNRALWDEHHRTEARIHCTRPAIFAASVLRKGQSDDPCIISALASLVAQHGARHEDHDRPLGIDPSTKTMWVELLRRWIDVMIASQTAGRHELAYVGEAVGRLGLEELVPDLKRLLDEELSRFRSARQGHADALRRGMIVTSSDASMHYDNQYRASFIHIGGDVVATLAAQYLEDRDFGFSAALIIKSISDRQLGVPEPGWRRQWPWFDGVDAARKSRAAQPQPAPQNALAMPIFAAIDRLARPEAEKEDQSLAITLTRIALSLPHGDHEELVARVLALPQPLATKQMLLAAVVLDGQIIDVDLVMRAIDDWLLDASSEANKAWHKRQDNLEIERWVELLPFTTRPDAVLDGLTKVKAFYGRDWAKRWERVLTAVAAIPGSEGIGLLGSLARAHKNIADEHAWVQAFLNRGTLESVLMYVDLFIERIFGTEPHGVDAWHVGRQLAEYAQRFPELTSELRKRYETVGAGPGRRMLEEFFGETASEVDLLAMVKKYAADNKAYDGQMARTVEAVAVDKVPVGEGSNAYSIYPAPVGKLRKALFDLLDGSPAEAALAKRCLVAIDKLRDEHGIAANDPRHPDVTSERPWPPEAT